MSPDQAQCKVAWWRVGLLLVAAPGGSAVHVPAAASSSVLQPILIALVHQIETVQAGTVPGTHPTAPGTV